jgi:glucose-1-phosphate thymidylyltransferase
MNRALLDALEGGPNGVADGRTRVEGRVSIDPTAVIEASVIRGPAVIGPGARVSHSFVGPYTALGPGVWLEGAEIEHSIVLEAAQILHVGGRIEASVIGHGTRVVKDFSVPRSLRMQLGSGASVRL